MMKLLLTSSGNTNKSIENALRNLIAKPIDRTHITFIPTAANIEVGDKTWLVKDMHNFQKLKFASFDIVDIAAVGEHIWLPSLKKADVLVFGGGNVSYLLEWMHKSGLKKMLPDLLKDKIYVGISAGSMVTAKHVSLSTAGIIYYEKTGEFENVPGLGFINFEVRPHLNSKWFPKAREEYLSQLAEKVQEPFYAIDDDSAIKVIDDEIEIISEGKWIKFN